VNGVKIDGEITMPMSKAASWIFLPRTERYADAAE
jgi:hypothetical protein